MESIVQLKNIIESSFTKKEEKSKNKYNKKREVKKKKNPTISAEEIIKRLEENKCFKIIKR